MAVATGTRLGPYVIDSLLGTGGMGEVYPAHDTRLKRDVALKILPASSAGDPERLARFQREAHVLASLDHPNIGAIYGIEESNGITALVLQLVEGDTLTDRIARGPIPLEEALPRTPAHLRHPARWPIHRREGRGTGRRLFAAAH